MSMNFKEYLDDIMSTEDVNVSADETEIPEDATKTVNDKGESDNGPDKQDPVDLNKSDDVDDIFNEEHTDDNPASYEELENIEEEPVPTNEEIGEMSEAIPENIEEGDLNVDEEGVEVSEPIETETSDENSGEEEVGVDPNQALECIIQSREEEIQLIKGDTQVSIGDDNNVSVNTNSNTDESSDNEGSDDNQNSSDDEMNTENQENSEGGENSDQDNGGETNSDDNSTEDLHDISKFFC